MSLFTELKRRNVIRMGGLYLVGAWFIAQIAETLLPIFHTPEWVLQALVVLLALGFIPALVFSWIFELTPDGLKRDAEVDATQAVARRTAKRMDLLTLVGVLALFALIAADRFWPRDPASPDSPASVSEPPESGVAREPGLVAVLPFRNRSARAEDAYFAEGIHDDLLTQLSKIPGLKVISRTSVMRYANTEKSIPEIATELGAAVVLEGAVQRAGDQVRVNMQLIDAASDVHLWAENYDRTVSTETIFAIQADIAQAVAGAMQVVLTPDQTQALVTAPTGNLQAYEAYLRGKLLIGNSDPSAEQLQAALNVFNQAIALDPAFAAAYAGKARALLQGYWFSLLPASALDDAKTTIDQARALAPEAIETHLAQAYYDYWGNQDYSSANARLQRILQLAPDNGEAWAALGYVARRDGRFDESISAMRHALELDPLNNNVLTSLAESLRVLGHSEEAARILKRAEGIGADTRTERAWLGEWLGDAQASWLAVDGPLPSNSSITFHAALLTRNPEHISLALSPALWPEDRYNPSGFPDSHALAQAEALLVQGETDQALQLATEIRERLQQKIELYPGRWAANAHYYPCYLPGLLGDLDAVKAAERDYLDNAPADAWAASDIHFALAVAFARAGDADWAMDYLEGLVQTFGPATYLRFSINPGLDSLRDQPRYLALQRSYETWKKAQSK